MIGRRVLAAAYLLDWVAGDPEWFPHPVRLLGRCIEWGEGSLRRPGQSAGAELMSGGALTCSVVAGTWLLTAKTISWANFGNKRKSRWHGTGVEIALAWTCLASRSLHNEASGVVAALEAEDLPLARGRLARIVGRDTQHLDAAAISRAVIETVAESASDGVVAPLFYLVAGGVPLAMAYKAVNTLDSMIGHADQRYFYFGKLAARLDDAANFIPARLTALGIAAAAMFMDGAKSRAAVDTWLRDGSKHKSPNAGQPESAMAGALQVQLGGTNFYKGERVAAHVMGEGFARPTVERARQATQIAAAVSFLGFAAALLLLRKRR